MTAPRPSPSSDALRWGALSAALVLLGCVAAYSQYWAALTRSGLLSALQLLPLAATPAAVALAVATVVQRGVMRERLLVITLLATAIGPVGYMGRAGLFWIEYTIAGMQVGELTEAIEGYRTHKSALPPSLGALVPEFLPTVPAYPDLRTPSGLAWQLEGGPQGYSLVVERGKFTCVWVVDGGVPGERVCGDAVNAPTPRRIRSPGS